MYVFIHYSEKRIRFFHVINMYKHLQSPYLVPQFNNLQPCKTRIDRSECTLHCLLVHGQQTSQLQACLKKSAKLSQLELGSGTYPIKSSHHYHHQRPAT